AKAGGEPAVHLPLVLYKEAEFLPLDIEVGFARYPDREPVRIGARIGRVEISIAGRERERAVQVASVENVEGQVVVTRPELQIVVALLAGQEPCERLIQLIRRILTPVRTRGDAVLERLVGEQRVQRSLVAGLEL